MSYVDIASANNIARLSRLLESAIKRRDRHIDKEFNEITQKQRSKRDAEISWAAMEIDKLQMQLHVALVDCGLADARPLESYSEIFFGYFEKHFQVKSVFNDS